MTVRQENTLGFIPPSRPMHYFVFLTNILGVKFKEICREIKYPANSTSVNLEIS